MLTMQVSGSEWEYPFSSGLDVVPVSWNLWTGIQSLALSLSPGIRLTLLSCQQWRPVYRRQAWLTWPSRSAMLSLPTGLSPEIPWVMEPPKVSTEPEAISNSHWSLSVCLTGFCPGPWLSLQFPTWNGAQLMRALPLSPCFLLPFLPALLPLAQRGLSPNISTTGCHGKSLEMPTAFSLLYLLSGLDQNSPHPLDSGISTIDHSDCYHSCPGLYQPVLPFLLQLPGPLLTFHSFI